MHHIMCSKTHVVAEAAGLKIPLPAELIAHDALALATVAAVKVVVLACI